MYIWHNYINSTAGLHKRSTGLLDTYTYCMLPTLSRIHIIIHILKGIAVYLKVNTNRKLCFPTTLQSVKTLLSNYFVYIKWIFQKDIFKQPILSQIAPPAPPPGPLPTYLPSKVSSALHCIFFISLVTTWYIWLQNSFSHVTISK